MKKGNLDKIGRQFGLFLQDQNPWYDWVFQLNLNF